MANNSLNDLSSASNTDKSRHTSEVARLEYGYAIDDEDFEPGGY